MPHPPHPDRQSRRDRRARSSAPAARSASRRCWPRPQADRDSVPARLADRTVCIGPARPAESYLKVDDHRAGGAGDRRDAIHPGYGFLSERAALARLCETAGRDLHRPDRRRRSRRSATSCARAPRPRPPTCRSCPAARSTSSRRRMALARADRRAAAGQGGGRRRRPRHEAGRPARGSARSAGAGRRRGRRGLRRRARLPGALRRARPARRSAGAGRWRGAASSTWASAIARCSAAIRS